MEYTTQPPLTVVVLQFRDFPRLGLRLILDMATVELRVVSKTSCTGYDKSNDKTESCKKQSVARQL